MQSDESIDRQTQPVSRRGIAKRSVVSALIATFLPVAILTGCSAPDDSSAPEGSGSARPTATTAGSRYSPAELKSRSFADSPDREQVFPLRVRVVDPTWKAASDSEILRLGRIACDAFESGQDQSGAAAAVKAAAVGIRARASLSAVAEGSLALRARETLCAPKLSAREKSFIAAYRKAGGRNADSDDQTVLSAGEGACELLAVKSLEDSVTALEQFGYTEADARAELVPAAQYLC